MIGVKEKNYDNYIITHTQFTPHLQILCHTQKYREDINTLIHKYMDRLSVTSWYKSLHRCVHTQIHADIVERLSLLDITLIYLGLCYFISLQMIKRKILKTSA